jgi:protein SCO1/2
MTKKILWIALASLMLVVFVAAVLSFVNKSNQTFHGSQIAPPMLAPDFTLTSQSSTPMSLSDFQGKYVLLFFGYTNCPDICPATMGVLMQVKNRLEDQANNVQILFITTDPAHDTPQVLEKFISRFDPSFIGLTGTETELELVWADYGVTVMDNGTTHSSRVYLIDPDGNIPLTYPSANSVEDITADLTRLFKGN